MEKELKYPIKYAILELKENGGWPARYQDLTRGFIVSKCYLISSSIEYHSDGKTQVSHKVVFPYNNLERFKQLLYDNREVLGDRIVPRYNASNQIYPCHVVTDIFDSFEEAHPFAEEKNRDLHSKHSLDISFLDPKWKESYQKREQEFERDLAICKRYEILVEEETRDLIVSKEIVPQLIKKK